MAALTSTLEDAALRFAAAEEAERHSLSNPPPRDFKLWTGRNAARVELLIAMSRNAIETWDADLGLYLLQAAESDNGFNVDDGPLPENPFQSGRNQRRLHEEIVLTAARALDLFNEGSYSDCATYSAAEDFQRLISKVERHWQLEREHNKGVA